MTKNSRSLVEGLRVEVGLLQNATPVAIRSQRAVAGPVLAAG